MSYKDKSNPIAAIAKHHNLNDRGAYVLAGKILIKIQGGIVDDEAWHSAVQEAFGKTRSYAFPDEVGHGISDMIFEIKRHRGLL